MKYNPDQLRRYKKVEISFPNLWKAIKNQIEDLLDFNRKDQDWDIANVPLYLSILDELETLLTGLK